MRISSEGLNLIAAAALAFAVSPAVADFMSQPGVPSAYGTQYATDAFPGFDREDEIIAPSKKTPRLFSWWNGPEKGDATAQFAWALSLEEKEKWSAAAKEYDALVREWPLADEAPRAQSALARILRDNVGDYEGAFEEYRYLLDYYPTRCEFDAVARELYETAKLMRSTGKRWVFWRFANTIDVRRAYEAVVLRAPGAPFAAEAMYAICELRVDEEEYDKAVEVCENLRNLYPLSAEAKSSLRLEAEVRMRQLRTHEYNRLRCEDTLKFLNAALATPLDTVTKNEFMAWRDEAVGHIEDEAFAAARFYDSKTRTRRGAISAYERFLSEYPASRHVEEARARLDALKGAVKEATK